MYTIDPAHNGGSQQQGATEVTTILFSIAIGLFGCDRPAVIEHPSHTAIPVTIPQAQPPTRVAVQHIFISHDDTPRSGDITHRSRSQAKQLAQATLRQLKEGADFGDTAMAHSDDPSQSTGGRLGPFQRGVFETAFEDAAFSLEIGEISDVVETSGGFHVIQRYKIEEVRLGQILIRSVDVTEDGSVIPSSQTLILAQQAAEQLSSGVDLRDVAAQYSDGSNADSGGDLGWVSRGQMLPVVEEAAFDLSVGDIAEVQSHLGVHVIIRIQ